MEITLKYISGDKAGQVERFQGPLFNLGGKSDNDVVLSAADGSVAGYHAQIRQDGDTVVLQDMGSASGTFVNDTAAKRVVLAEGDQVRLGEEGPRFFVEWVLSETPTAVMSPSDDKLYGQRTVGLMIAQALKSAGALKTGMHRSTAYFEAMLEKRLKLNTRRYRVAATVVVVTFIILAIVFGLYTWRASKLVSSGKTTIVATPGAGGPVAQANRSNIFVIAGQPRGTKDDSEYVGFCTAFAISPNLLATNAHCIEDARQRFSGVVALMNESPDKRYRVVRMMPHPSYTAAHQSEDVGLLQISGMLDSFVKLAVREDLASILPGSATYLYGFPGTLNNLANPVATFASGDIGRVTTLTHGVGPYEENVLLQHSAVTSRGTSGSPMFNGEGVVIGINVGGYADHGKALAGYNFGMRIDLLTPLIESLTAEPAP